MLQLRKMARRRFYLQGISVARFKSLHRGAIELRPLTIVAGANSAGKSSLFQPLLLLKQTLESPFDPGPLLLSGPNVKFTSADQMLWKTPGSERSKTFEIGLYSEGSNGVKLNFKRSGNNFELSHMTIDRGEENREIFRADMSSTQLEQILPPHLRNLRKSLAESQHEKLTWKIARKRCYFEIQLGQAGKDFSYRAMSTSPFEIYGVILTSLIHVPGLRGNPQRSYPSTAAASDSFPGEFTPYVATIIETWQRDDDERTKILGDWTKHLGLTWKVSADRIDESQIRIVVGRLSKSRRGGAKDLVNISDVGFGMSQSLPVLVALLAARPGQIVLLEQPEIHLHPLAQYQLADILVQAVKRGVRPIVETHSSILLRALQTKIASGELDSQDTVLHWCSRDEDIGDTRIDSQLPDKNGAYGDWPVDFDDVTLNAEARYLDEVEKRQARKS